MKQINYFFKMALCLSLYFNLSSCTNDNGFVADVTTNLNKTTSFNSEDNNQSVIQEPNAESIINSKSLKLKGSCSDKVSSISLKTNRSLSTPCISSKWSLDLSQTTLPQGNNTIEIVFLSSTGAILKQTEQSIYIDNIAPRLEIADFQQLANKINAKGSCESELPIYVNGTGLALGSYQVLCLNEKFNLSIDVTNVSEEKSVKLSQIDPAKNETTVVNKINYIAQAPKPPNPNPSEKPTASINLPAVNSIINIQNVERFILSGTCSENSLAVVIKNIGSTFSQSTICQNNSWQLSLNLKQINDGQVNLIVSHKNINAVESDPSQRQFIKDTVAPILTFNSPAPLSEINSQNNYQVLVSGLCNVENKSFTIKESNQNQTFSTTCSAGSFSKLLNLSNLSNAQFTLSAQIEDDAGNKSQTASLQLVKVAAPVQPPGPNPGVITPVACSNLNLTAASEQSNYTMYKDIRYGNDDTTYQVFDYYRPKVAPQNGQFPLAIFFHGGGFGVTATANKVYSLKADERDYLIANGIAVISVEYRPLQNEAVGTTESSIGDQTKGVLVQLKDSARALQFIKCHASTFKINPENIVLWGSSAGSSISLWLAFKDNMAKNSTDPVETWSTKIKAVAAGATQGTLDGVYWEKKMFKSPSGGKQAYCFQIESMQAKTEEMLNIPHKLYSRSLLETNPALIAYRHEIDLLAHLDANDPEFYVSNGKENTDPGGCSNGNGGFTTLYTDPLYHHPYQALELKDKAIQVGAKSFFIISGLPENEKRSRVPNSNLEPIDSTLKEYIVRKLASVQINPPVQPGPIQMPPAPSPMTPPASPIVPVQPPSPSLPVARISAEPSYYDKLNTARLTIVQATSADDAVAKINAAQPNTKIIIPAGDYTNKNFIINRSGTADNPIILEGQANGSTKFIGKNNFKVSGAHLLFKNLNFQNIDSNTYGSSSAIFMFEQCQYCGLYNSKFENSIAPVIVFNEKGEVVNDEKHFKDVLISAKSQSVEIAFNTFKNKQNQGSNVLINRSTTRTTMYEGHRIFYNLFSGRTLFNYGANDFDNIRIGSSDTSFTPSRDSLIDSLNNPENKSVGNVIEFNVIEDTHINNLSCTKDMESNNLCKGEPELISVKAPGTIVRFNTLRNNFGGLTLRHGYMTIVEGNFISGVNAPKNISTPQIASYGLRVIGDSHIVVHNHIENTSSSSRLTGGLSLLPGQPNAQLNGYTESFDHIIAMNFIKNVSSKPISLASDYGGRSKTILPTKVVLSHNIISGGTAAINNQAPNEVYLSGFKFIQNYFDSTNLGLGLDSAAIRASTVAVDSTQSEFARPTLNDYINTNSGVLSHTPNRNNELIDSLSTLTNAISVNKMSKLINLLKIKSGTLYENSRPLQNQEVGANY